MKICAECKFYSENQGIIKVVQSCRAPKIPEIARLILGERYGVDQAQIDAMMIRYNDNLCGVEGKWYEKME